MELRFGRQLCASLDDASAREWLLTDGLGGYASGTVAGLRTRRYHGLLVVARQDLDDRRLALVSLDPVLVLSDRRVRLATHEWSSGAVDPDGYLLLASFALIDGVPRWRWQVGDLVLEREVAMVRGRPAVGVVHRLVRGDGPVLLELEALCTWRDAHGARTEAAPLVMENLGDGAVVEGQYRMRGPGYSPTGQWYREAFYREEALRGLNRVEDLWHAGRFSAELLPGGVLEVEAWADDFAAPPPPATAIVAAARRRAVAMAERSRPSDDVDRLLAIAADQHVVAGPRIVAGYPWSGQWKRDTF
ncbi:MAG: amylo-alpha,6-glucosidase, partial [Acidimicrobiia bacterium]|nr:amylo-alpha,6-glucosidase [Acidimicrobiia bacterium]